VPVGIFDTDGFFKRNESRRVRIKRGVVRTARATSCAGNLYTPARTPCIRNRLILRLFASRWQYDAGGRRRKTFHLLPLTTPKLRLLLANLLRAKVAWKLLPKTMATARIARHCRGSSGDKG
jgi:hypothetical protein